MIVIITKIINPYIPKIKKKIKHKINGKWMVENILLVMITNNKDNMILFINLIKNTPYNYMRCLHFFSSF